MRAHLPLFATALGLGLLATACAGDDLASEVQAASSLPFAEGSAEALAVLALVNDRAVTTAELDFDAALDARAARAIVAHRDGADGLLRTADDDLYDTLGELYGVRYAKAKAIKQLLAYAKAKGYYDDELAKEWDVIFSPQPYGESHLARVASLVDGAERSIDVAMYSFSDAKITEALDRAVERGVAVRFVFDPASKDKSLTGSALASSKSGQLEQLGINVRYVNKIMHHKFMIVDGPRDERDAAWDATVVTGSGNWSNSAGTRYDENTLFLTAYPEVALRLQAEFDLMWNHSRDFVFDATLPYELSTLAIVEEIIPECPSTHGFFTSQNFVIKGTDTFSVNGASTVADELVAGIQGARRSIHIASGHLRSRPVSEALMAKVAEDPSIDVRVLLDGQEYISNWAAQEQKSELEDCLAAAGDSAAAIRNCMDKGYYFGLEVAEAGAQVRYKYYSYRWHYSYAEQMHHKYIVIDGTELYTGSYNLSDNAEHNTFENMLMFRGPEFSELVARYEQNFEQIWELRRAEGTYEQLLAEIDSAAVVPIVFPPMALDWQQITNLKSLIRTECPAVDSSEYRDDPQGHTKCYK